MDQFNNSFILEFQRQIQDNLSNNITRYVQLSLGTILAIDYETRLNSTPNIYEYAATAIKKIRYFLKQKVLTDDSFSTVLILFTVAIAPDTKTYNDNKDNFIDSSNKIVINALIESNFSNLSEDERLAIFTIFKNIFADKNKYDLLNFVHKEREILTAIIMHSIKKYPTAESASKFALNELNKILSITEQHEKKINNFKQATSKIVTAICTLAVGAISVLTSGAFLAIAVIPYCVFAVKYAPKLGEQLGGAILLTDKAIKIEEEHISQLKATLKTSDKDFLKKYDLVKKFVKSSNVISELEIAKAKELSPKKGLIVEVIGKDIEKVVNKKLSKDSTNKIK